MGNDNELTINSRKTKITQFRKRERIAEERIIYHDGKKLESFSDYKYLNITLQTMETVFHQT
jgi:hypothetical protein